MKAGKRLRLRLVLANPAGNDTVPLSLPDPEAGGWAEGPAVPQPGFPFPFEQE